MLMDIKCSEVSSVLVTLTFDDGTKKENLVSIGDLVDVEYNANGMRKHVEGKVVKISTAGLDPKGWYIIVDGSDDFQCGMAKFSPMSILDLEIIRKANTMDTVQTPIDCHNLPYLRIVKGRLQWSKDGFSWLPVKIDARDVVDNDIEPAEGTAPVSGSSNTSGNCGCNTSEVSTEDDGLEEAEH